MNAVYSCVLAFVVLLAVCNMFYILFSKHRRSNRSITIGDMEDTEIFLNNLFCSEVKKYRKRTLLTSGKGSIPVSVLDIEKLADYFNLEIEQSNSISRGIRGKLTAANDGKNGLISYKNHTGGEAERYNNFNILHEMCHYIFDVGEGNKVAREYNNPSPETPKRYHEQETDYRAAALAMPSREILDIIKTYNDEEDLMNSVEMIASIYNQPSIAVERRIKEVQILNDFGLIQ